MDTAARSSLPDDANERFKPRQTEDALENTSLSQQSCSLGATGELLPAMNALDPAWMQPTSQHERQQASPDHNALSLGATGELAAFRGISPRQDMESGHSNDFFQTHAYTGVGE